jgi:hypothetical protein
LCQTFEESLFRRTKAKVGGDSKDWKTSLTNLDEKIQKKSKTKKINQIFKMAFERKLFLTFSILVINCDLFQLTSAGKKS